MANDGMLTTREVAALIIGRNGHPVSRRTVARMAERGDLPYLRKLPGVGQHGAYVFDRHVVEMFVRQLAKAAAS